MSPTSPSTRPFNSKSGRKKKLNLAFVEDPLLATAAASWTAPPPSQLTPPADLPRLPPLDIPGKIPPIEALAEELEADAYAAMSVPDQEPIVSKPHLITHAKVYAVAEKYGIRGLKALSRKKFSSQMSHHWISAEFPLAIQDVYDTTVDSDRGLRDIVIQTFREHPQLAQRRDVEDVVKETPNLAWELFRVGWGLPVTS
jgi:hypothetical protein